MNKRILFASAAVTLSALFAVAQVSHETVSFGAITIEAGGTNVVETTFRVTGVLKGALVNQVGAGAATTTVSSVRSGVARTVVAVSTDNSAVQTNVTHNLYSERLRFTIVNSATNSVTIEPSVIYEK